MALRILNPKRNDQDKVAATNETSMTDRQLENRLGLIAWRFALAPQSGHWHFNSQVANRTY
jgi:hypothetical protein